VGSLGALLNKPGVGILSQYCILYRESMSCGLMVRITLVVYDLEFSSKMKSYFFYLEWTN
jgi:hypothetical protein